MNTLVNGDCAAYLETIRHCQTIIADPPDNLGLGYDGFVDDIPNYYGWLCSLIRKSITKSNHFWLTYYHAHDLAISSIVYDEVRRKGLDWHKYIWRFEFGQHVNSDCGSGYRSILRISQPGQELNTKAILTPSKRQTLYGDKRAKEGGRVPDDVWCFPRIVGNSAERRPWHPAQINGAIYSRILRLSSKPGDDVIDLFGGTGTLFRANGQYAEKDRRKCVCVEISRTYCEHIASEHQLRIETC